MSTAPHHLERTQRYHRFARDNIADGQFARAADALRRSVTHAASALLVSEGRPTSTRQRLDNALLDLTLDGRIPHAHVRTFRIVHRLPDLLQGRSDVESRRLLRTVRTRVGRLIKAVAALVNGNGLRSLAEEMANPRLLCDRPGADELHTTTPARCNNLSPVGSPNAQLAYNPAVCPKCASLFVPHASRNLNLPRLYAINSDAG